MKFIRQPVLAIVVLLSGFLLAGCRTAADNQIQAANSGPSKVKPEKLTRTVTIPAGTEIVVRLVDAVGSGRNSGGDKFLASLDQPIVVNDWVAVARGTNVMGRVLAAQPSGHLKTPAELAITLTSLQMGGDSYEIKTSSFSRRGQAHSKRNAEWIGGSAAGGALIGALLGKGKGAAIGAAAGAGGGTATAYATGKKDILLPSETRLRFVLKEPVTIVKTG